MSAADHSTLAYLIAMGISTAGAMLVWWLDWRAAKRAENEKLKRGNAKLIWELKNCAQRFSMPGRLY